MTPAPSAGTPPPSSTTPLASLPATASGVVVSRAAEAPSVPTTTTATATTTVTATSTATTTTTSAPGGATLPTPSSGNPSENDQLAARSRPGADDSLLLAALVLGFTFAVSGVVVAAGLRGGGRRVR